MTFHTEELGINLEPLTAKDGIRLLITRFTGYGEEQSVKLHWNVHPQPINPEMAFSVTDEA